MRPDFYGLKIEPAVPKDWEEFEIEKDFRGKHLHITVCNPGHAQCGCKKLILDGETLEGNYIPESLMKDRSEIKLYIS